MKVIKLGDNTNALLGVATCPIVIVNKHHGMQGEYIGRGSPLGNPFVIGVHGTRKEVIDKYKVLLNEQIANNNPVVLAELNRLGNKAIDDKGLALQCFCHPKPCHGEVIKEKLVQAMYTYFEEHPNG